MILTKQLDFSSGSSITTPRINLVRELERYNRQQMNLAKESVMENVKKEPPIEPSDEPRKVTEPQPARSVSRPNILSRRSKPHPAQRSSSVDSITTAAASISTSLKSPKLSSPLATFIPKIASMSGSSIGDFESTKELKEHLQSSVEATAMLTIPNPSYLGKSNEKISAIPAQTSSDKSHTVIPKSSDVSIISESPTSVTQTLNTQLSSSTTSSISVSKSNTIHVGSVLKASIVSDPTQLPVMMPIATSNAIPASPEDVVLPAGKGYVVFKPMGNLSKDCVVSVESSTGIINAVIDPKKFTPSSPSLSSWPKTFPVVSNIDPIMSSQPAASSGNKIATEEVRDKLKIKVLTAVKGYTLEKKFLLERSKHNDSPSDVSDNICNNSNESAPTVFRTKIFDSRLEEGNNIQEQEMVVVKIDGNDSNKNSSSSTCIFPKDTFLPVSQTLKKVLTSPSENLRQEQLTRTKIVQVIKSKQTTQESKSNVTSDQLGVIQSISGDKCVP